MERETEMGQQSRKENCEQVKTPVKNSFVFVICLIIYRYTKKSIDH